MDHCLATANEANVPGGVKDEMMCTGHRVFWAALVLLSALRGGGAWVD